MSAFIVRAMQIEDIDEILEIFSRVADERLWIGTEPGYDRERYRAVFTHGIENHRAFFSAVIGGRIVGMCSEYPHEIYGSTIGMMIDIAHRRAGIGRALIAAVTGWAQAKGIPQISLLVFAHNEPALALYRSTGFSEVETYHRDVARSDGAVYDTILMRKMLRCRSAPRCGKFPLCED